MSLGTFVIIHERERFVFHKSLGLVLYDAVPFCPNMKHKYFVAVRGETLLQVAFGLSCSV